MAEAVIIELHHKDLLLCLSDALHNQIKIHLSEVALDVLRRLNINLRKCRFQHVKILGIRVLLEKQRQEDTAFHYSKHLS